MHDNLSKGHQIACNVALHDRIARKYDAIHCEMFIAVEQGRLGAARDPVRTGRQPLVD